MTAPNPIAGDGGPNTYPSLYNQAYYESKNPVFWPLFAGRPDSKGNDRWSVLTQLTQDQRWALVGKLIAAGWIVDEEIDAEGMDPFTTMFMRELYGNTWEPAGLGETQSTQVVTPGMFSGPVPNGAIKVTTNAADLVAHVPPPAPATPPSSAHLANPIGQRITFNSPAAIGDWFRPLANDGYNVTDTWIGTAGSYSGTWTKQALELGLMIIWTKTA